MAGLSGRVAGGFQRGLAEEMARQTLEAERARIAAAQEQSAALQQARFDEETRRTRVQEERNARLDAEAAGDRAEVRRVEGLRARGRSNMAGVVGMGLDPQDASRELAFTALNNDVDIPNGVMDVVNPKPEPLVTRTVAGPNGKPIIRGLTRRDLETGAYQEYQEPSAPPTPREPSYLTLVSPDGKQQQRVPDGQSANALLQQGWKLFDQVGARQTANNSLDPKAADDTRQQILQAAKDLLNHPGLDAFTGTTFNPQHGFGWYDDPIGGTDAASAKALYDNFVSLSALPNLEKLRGPLSDKDIEFIKAASTRAKPRSKDSDFRKELGSIIQKLEGSGGGTKQVTMQQLQAIAAKRGTTVEQEAQRAAAEGFTVIR